jgi:hypothetical protein
MSRSFGLALLGAIASFCIGLSVNYRLVAHQRLRVEQCEHALDVCTFECSADSRASSLESWRLPRGVVTCAL